MTSELDLKKKHRKVLRCSFSKTANELDLLLKTDPVAKKQVSIVWECLKEKSEVLRTCESIVYEKMLENDASEEQLLQEMDSCDVYSKRFIELRLLTEECLDVKPEDEANSTAEFGVTTRSTGVVTTTGKRKFLLPQIQFKQYDGNIREWLAFWSQFRKIHTDNDIDKCDKIEYLIQATVPGSRARQIVESFPVVGENYEKIIECMTSRFGRQDLQTEVYVRELLKLVLNNVMSQQQLILSELYDQIETQLRALDTLGITSDKYAALLFPLIESCLPQELLRIWQRSSISSGSLNSSDSLETRLLNLMNFIRAEVENEQKIDLANEGFGLLDNYNGVRQNVMLGNDDGTRNSGRSPKRKDSHLVTAAGLVNTKVAKCVFCSGTHDGAACFKAQKMSMEERKIILSEKKACFRCLKVGHQARKCRTRLKCIVCARSHVPLMCQNLLEKKKPFDEEENTNVGGNMVKKEQALTNQNSTHVFLQTFRANVRGVNSTKNVRALIDSGSQRSYILKSTALSLGLRPKRAERIMHCLFGGTQTENTHHCYDITLFKSDYSTTFEVLDQPFICNELTPVFYGPWMQELRSLNIEISDSLTQGPIEMLIGADIAGSLYTGKRCLLKCGLVAYETHVGWTIEGKVPGHHSHTMSVMSLLVNPSITQLWELDVLGIQDSAEKVSRNEMALAVKELFLQTITVNEESRYEVSLPWLDGHPELPTNFRVANKRLEITLQKLERDNLVSRYNDVFKEWEARNIIEKTEKDYNLGHFLPHRPVIKEGSTTAVRPVFDASACEKGKPSLNQCLDKGINLIELIPSLLIRFREHEIGVVADIKKAFLQISMNKADRSFLKFLWVGEQGERIVYRHNRVVFGVNSSPFLLGMTIEHHLSKSLENCSLPGWKYTKETVEKLSKSFYVDNCVASVPNKQILNKFIREAVHIMAEAQFDLRGWEFSRSVESIDKSVSVLGLKWYPHKDVLTINPDFVTLETKGIVTKRKLLSVAQKVFDPIGFTSPATLLPKLWLQKLWENQISWDAEVDSEIAALFENWVDDLPNLLKIEIPRWVRFEDQNIKDVSIHTFVDASKDAYAAVVFARVVQCGEVYVCLLAAKSRVAPIRKLTIPRLELMAATIGSRLFTQVIENLSCNYESYFWSDSSTVIQWIRRNEEWGTFVYNRVAEIRRLAPPSKWRHIPGVLNPADLPSRGCMPKYLLDLRWWEGPQWLYEVRENWPCTAELQINEEEINSERKKSTVKTLTNLSQRATDFFHLTKFSSFEKTVRMIAAFFRFIHNLTYKKKRLQKKSGNFTVNELQKSEEFIFKKVQKESFSGPEDNQIKSLKPKYDKQGIIRLESRVSNRPNETEDFKYPIVLPGKHPVVYSLIKQTHEQNCHVGTQGLLANLREHYWILGGRKTLRSIIKKCTICRRYDAKPLVVETPPLPADRVRDVMTFEISGVDFAGPLFLKSGEKAWVCLFTCAVYRCVHLELTLSLSTNCFLQVLRRFVARRGRPKILYSDNGTNFKGTDNAFASLDWEKIERETAVQRIEWRFNPPTASWWGGFFERLIGLMKNLLRKVLGKSSLHFEELMTLLCDCESVLNSRPLTYISSDPNDLKPLTPVMFLREQVNYSMPDCDEVDKSSLSSRMRYIQSLRDNLRCRFRLEYLGLLTFLVKGKQSPEIKLGQVVLIGNDCSKRIEWPLGRVIELLPGRDGLVRLVRVKSQRGELLRPVQRLIPLECENSEATPNFEEDEAVADQPQDLTTAGEDVNRPGDEQQPERGDLDEVVSESVSARKKIEFDRTIPEKCVTRSGRSVKIPNRFL